MDLFAGLQIDSLESEEEDRDTVQRRSMFNYNSTMEIVFINEVLNDGVFPFLTK